MPRMVPSVPKSQFFTSVKPGPNVLEVGAGPTAGLAGLPPPTVWTRVDGIAGPTVGARDGPGVVDGAAAGRPLVDASESIVDADCPDWTTAEPRSAAAGEVSRKPVAADSTVKPTV